ncbi:MULTISPECIES: hypothetical protein [unclassified Streptomyces]|uniref:hypothetical protein n=1 Tax=unclassified Streptomyces TaxID=2593676 RepID=UPI000A797FFC|nr:MULTISPECIES: hypothetical protein [unclassified Streptomyces]
MGGIGALLAAPLPRTLNTAEPLLTGRYGRACLDTVAPLLLLGWGHVGPAFLAQFHTHTRPVPQVEATAPVSEPVPDEAPASEPPTPAPVVAASPAEEPRIAPAPAAAVAKAAQPAAGPTLPTALLDAARRIADAHCAEHGTPITAAHLGTRMGVALPVATAALAQL